MESKVCNILLSSGKTPCQNSIVICSPGIDAGPTSASKEKFALRGIAIGLNGLSSTVVLHFLVLRFSLYSVL